MADNIYLLETRLSKAQQAALAAVRGVAKERGVTVFLVGGAVRDLIGGTAVRDLDVVIQGNALKLRKDIEKAGGVTAGELEAGQAFFVRFPGGVRMEIGSTLSVTYPKPGKAVFKPATILEDLRRRDFTANAMALSLNEGSYGLLMDPLNGVADIENRELRLVSNYGFIEDPVRMIRASRLMARLGWGMEEKTQSRYETGKAEGYISAMDEFHRGYETEEIFHEEDPLRVMRRLEEEGWMQHLAPALSATKANVAELERLRESQAQLQTQGVVADAALAKFPLLTAKMAPKEVEALKKSFPRPGFVAEIDHAEEMGKAFAAQLGAKGAAQPSQAYKLILASDPEAVLWAAHTTKSGTLQAKFKSFYTDWPQARQRLPYLLLQEMRITPELPDYEGLVEKIFLELMDGKLSLPEEMKAYLEPYSPPAPPPPVSLRRPRAAKKEAKPAKSRKKVAAEITDEVDDSAVSGPEGSASEETTGSAAQSSAAGSAAGHPDTNHTGTKKAEASGKQVGAPDAKKVEAGAAAAGLAEKAPPAAKSVKVASSKVRTPEQRPDVAIHGAPTAVAATPSGGGATGKQPGSAAAGAGSSVTKPAGVATMAGTEGRKEASAAAGKTPSQVNASKVAAKDASSKTAAAGTKASGKADAVRGAVVKSAGEKGSGVKVPSKPVAAKTADAKPVAAKAIAAKSVAAKSVAAKSVATKPTASKPVAAKSMPAKKVAATTAGAKTAGAKTAGVKSGTKAAAVRPVAAKKGVVAAKGSHGSPAKHAAKVPVKKAPTKVAAKKAPAKGGSGGGKATGKKGR